MEVDVLEDDFDMNENTQRTKIGPIKNQRCSSISPDQRTKELFSPEDAINNDFFYDDELVLKESVCSEFSVDLNRPLFTPRSSIHEEIMEETNEEVNSFHLDIAACNEHRYYLSFAQNVQKLEISDPPSLRSSTADSMQNWAGKSYANEVANEATWPEIMKASDCSGNNNTRPKEEKVLTTWKTIGKQQEEATRSKSLGDLNVQRVKPSLNKTKSVQEESEKGSKRQSAESLVEAFQKVRYQFPDVDLAQIANTAWSMTPSSCDLQWPNEKKDFAVQTITRKAFSAYDLPDLNFLYEAREPPDLSFADGEKLPPFPDLDLLDEILQKNVVEQKSPKKNDAKFKSKIPTPKSTKSKIPTRASSREPLKKTATVSSSSSGIGSSVRNIISDTSTSDSDVCAGKTKKLLSPKRRAQNNMKKMENLGLSPNKEKVEKREGKRKARPASDPCLGEKLEEDMKRGRNPSDDDDKNSKKSVSFSENISYLSPQRRRGSCPGKTDFQPEEYLQVTMESSVTNQDVELIEKRKLFLRVIDSANIIKRHLAGARDSELQARLANTAVTPLVGHLLLEHFCPAICSLVQDGLRSKAPSLFGYLNNNIWKFVEDSANTGPTTRVLYEAIQDLNGLSFLTTPLMKFNAFIFALLNHKALDFWLSHVISEEKFLSRQHLPNSSLRLASGPHLGPLSLDMTDSLVPLCHIQWQLHYSFEYDQMERSEQRRLADSVLQKHMSRAHAHEHAQRALQSEHARIVMMDITKSKTLEQSHSDSEMRQSSSYLKRAGELLYKLLPPKHGKDQKIDIQDESLVEKVEDALEEQKPEAVKTKKRHSWSSLAPALVQLFDKLLIDTSKQPGEPLQSRMTSSRSESDLRGNFPGRMYRSRSEHI